MRNGFLILALPFCVHALLQPCEAASDAAELCDPQSASFYRRQPTVPWRPVASERVEEADYYGRVFEARILIGEQELFAYKVLMNIRGSPTYVSVALLDQAEERIDVMRLASLARLRLENEAMNAARAQGAREAIVSLSGNRNDILLWSLQSTWYFTVDAPERFSVFEIAGDQVRYVCTHQP